MLLTAMFSDLTPTDPEEMTGVLSADAFRLGKIAQDATDRILYDRKTGALYFDADGNGAGEAVQFAQLKAGADLSHLDFILFG